MYRLRVLLFATFSLAVVSAHAATEINYWLWDALQLPAYQAAAAAFEKANPDIKVKVYPDFLGRLLDDAEHGLCFRHGTWISLPITSPAIPNPLPMSCWSISLR